jgi:hypothetical protein
MNKNRVNALGLISISSAAMIPATYQPISATGSSYPFFLLRIQNLSNQAIFISYDGVTDHEYMTADSIFEMNTQDNASPNGMVALWPKGSNVWVKGAAGIGTIYASAYFQEIM